MAPHRREPRRWRCGTNTDNTAITPSGDLRRQHTENARSPSQATRSDAAGGDLSRQHKKIVRRQTHTAKSRSATPDPNPSGQHRRTTSPKHQQLALHKQQHGFSLLVWTMLNLQQIGGPSAKRVQGSISYSTPSPS